MPRVENANNESSQLLMTTNSATEKQLVEHLCILNNKSNSCQKSSPASSCFTLLSEQTSPPQLLASKVMRGSSSSSTSSSSRSSSSRQVKLESAQAKFETYCASTIRQIESINLASIDTNDSNEFSSELKWQNSEQLAEKKIESSKQKSLSLLINKRFKNFEKLNQIKSKQALRINKSKRSSRGAKKRASGGLIKHSCSISLMSWPTLNTNKPNIDVAIENNQIKIGMNNKLNHKSNNKGNSTSSSLSTDKPESAKPAVEISQETKIDQSRMNRAFRRAKSAMSSKYSKKAAPKLNEKLVRITNADTNDMLSQEESSKDIKPLDLNESRQDYLERQQANKLDLEGKYNYAEVISSKNRRLLDKYDGSVKVDLFIREQFMNDPLTGAHENVNENEINAIDESKCSSDLEPYSWPDDEQLLLKRLMVKKKYVLATIKQENSHKATSTKPCKSDSNYNLSLATKLKRNGSASVASALSIVGAAISNQNSSSGLLNVSCAFPRPSTATATVESNQRQQSNQAHSILYMDSSKPRAKQVRPKTTNTITATHRDGKINVQYLSSKDSFYEKFRLSASAVDGQSWPYELDTTDERDSNAKKINQNLQSNDSLLNLPYASSNSNLQNNKSNNLTKSSFNSKYSSASLRLFSSLKDQKQLERLTKIKEMPKTKEPFKINFNENGSPLNGVISLVE
jgi:hypothetical protein